MKVFRYILFILIVSCGNNNESAQTVAPTSLPPVIDTPSTSLSTTTTSTTTTTVVTYDGCIPEDNRDVNFNDLKKVQNFLNRYGFEAGTEDGLLGTQTQEAVKRFQAYEIASSLK